MFALSPSEPLRQFKERSTTKAAPLRADCVDLPDKAATCDPLKYMPDKVARELRGASTYFPDVLPDSAVAPKRFVGSTKEYAKLIVRLLMRGKVQLRLIAIASIFCHREEERQM